MHELNQVLCVDVLAGLERLEDESVHCVITSPPYWAMRDYEVENAYGLEKSAEEYVEKLVKVFREVKRVLRRDGTLWLNMGDCHNSVPGGYYPDGSFDRPSRGAQRIRGLPRSRKLKTKDLCGMPWRVAFALQAAGWWLRMDIIWWKPNPKPESVKDRPTKAHEYVFLMTKSGKAAYWTHRDKVGTRQEPAPDYRWRDRLMEVELGKEPDGWRAGKIGGRRRYHRLNLWCGHDYFYDQDAVREEYSTADEAERDSSVTGMRGVPPGGRAESARGRHRSVFYQKGGRNLRSVWKIATHPVTEPHYATFPERLVEPCIKAGTSEKGCCAECGAPWVRRVERTTRFEGGSGKAGRTAGDANAAGKWAGKQHGKNLKLGPVLDVRTTGWRPTCSCGAGVSRCIILDPFAGMGTVAVVAWRLGRDSIGFDLSSRYVEMANKRIGDSQGRRNGQGLLVDVGGDGGHERPGWPVWR